MDYKISKYNTTQHIAMIEIGTVTKCADKDSCSMFLTLLTLQGVKGCGQR